MVHGLLLHFRLKDWAEKRPREKFQNKLVHFEHYK